MIFKVHIERNNKDINVTNGAASNPAVYKVVMLYITSFLP